MKLGKIVFKILLGFGVLNILPLFIILWMRIFSENTFSVDKWFSAFILALFGCIATALTVAYKKEIEKWGS